MKGKINEEILKQIYVPCTIKGRGEKSYFRKMSILACMKRSTSNKCYHKECHTTKKGINIPCKKWEEYLPIIRKKIFSKIFYKITYQMGDKNDK